MIRTLRVLLCLAVFASCAQAQTVINGAGATFPNPIYQKWFSEYHNEHSDVQFNYQSIGSGGGIRQVQAGTVDFGASDGPMTDQQIAESKVKVVHLPTVLGAVVPAYNIPGVNEEIKFTPEVLAGIYLGKISNWSDPAIAKVEPEHQVPQPDHHRGASLRRQRNHLHLHRLPVEGELRVGRRTRAKAPRSNGRWEWAARATRGLRAI